MELLYIWVENYKGIFKKQEFNFRANEIFKYDEKNKTINVIYKNNYGYKLFGQNIDNITALVGQNGAGKSTVLDIIKDFFDNPYILSNHDFIFIFKCDEKYSVYHTKDFIFKINDNGLNKSMDDFFQENCEIDGVLCFEKIDILYKSHKIYFSNVFSGRVRDKNSESSVTDEKNNPRKNDYIHNITTDRLMITNKKEYADKYIYDVNIFEANEIINQIKFLFSEEFDNVKNKLKNIKEVNCLDIEIDDVNESIANKGIEENRKAILILKDFERIIREIREKFDKLMNEKVEDNIRGKRFRIKFLKSLMNYYFNILFKEDPAWFLNGNYYRGELEPYILNIDVDKWTYDKLYEYIKEFFNEWLKSIKEDIQYVNENSIENEDKELNNRRKKEHVKIVEQFKGLIDKAESVESIISEQIKNYQTKEYTYSINLDDQEEEKKKDVKDAVIKFIESFYNIIQERFLIVRYMNLNENRNYELSSGEKAFLTMFSRVYKVLNGIRNEENKSKVKDILILMDEPEIYMHPKWQRLFIQNSIDFFQQVFKEYNFQIILTSNTPFLASDLPKENIIFLENKDGQCKVCDNDNFEQTFGTNIHTLLTNSFFMDSTIGEFANQSIKSCLKIMDKYKQFHENKITKGKFKEAYDEYMNLKKSERNNDIDIEILKKKIERIIEIIGEPLIKRKLEEIYRTTFPKCGEDYAREIAKLQKEKAELQEFLKDNGLDKIENVMKLLDIKIRELKEKAGDEV